MTPYSIRCGLFVFVRVDDTGRIVGRCLASSLRAAQGQLGSVGVRSAASHAVPLPKAIAPLESGCRLCGRALVPGGAAFAGDVHERCRVRSARASAAYKKRRSSARPTLKGVPRSDAAKAKIAATQRARLVEAPPTGKQLAALRDANVRRGILRRAAAQGRPAL